MGQEHQRTVTNGSQTVTGTINYDSFGNTAGSTGSSTSAYLYGATSGYRTEGDAGLSHVGARYYDAQVGRFITRDTVLSEHFYLYCDHDPVNYTDPSGHTKTDAYGWILEGNFEMIWYPEPSNIINPITGLPYEETRTEIWIGGWLINDTWDSHPTPRKPGKDWGGGFGGGAKLSPEKDTTYGYGYFWGKF